ncbi:hypothetical protein DD238_007139 [Peronospora effusa]|uniref:Peptidase M13 C-terminal domain-containing protein n=1 Tax=Peronospora effusa TaxID=542832 RepID=A0A3M6VPG2_9STRA|nr:hypothetical protein DD238_007139 [Peronospora effusa]
MPWDCNVSKDPTTNPARNLASIGCIIGHKLTRGIDNSGRYYAGDGILRNWWSNDTANKF